MSQFRRVTDGFNFVYEKALSANETVILEMPKVSPHKKGVNDIGWQSDGYVTLYGTLSEDPYADTALWQKIEEGDEINKTVSALKIINNGSSCNVAVRAILF